MRIALIGVPYNSSGTTDGVARAPAALRAAGLIDALATRCDVMDVGDVYLETPTTARDAASGIIDPRNLKMMIRGVSGLVRQAIAEERLPLVIGGDCPVLLGCLAAARAIYGRVGLLFVDGHEDAWPPLLSTTGEAADMELGLALGVTAAPALPALMTILPLLQRDDVTLLGPRDAAEISDAQASSLEGAVPFVADAALRAADLALITRAAVQRIQAQAGRWWLHVDLDVLSTEAFPAIDYPQPGGLSWDELATVTSSALVGQRPVGMNVTIYNPDLDPDRRHAARIVEFLTTCVS